MQEAATAVQYEQYVQLRAVIYSAVYKLRVVNTEYRNDVDVAWSIYKLMYVPIYK